MNCLLSDSLAWPDHSHSCVTLYTDFDEEDDLSLSHLLPADVTFDEYAAVDADRRRHRRCSEGEEEEGDLTSLDLPGRPQAVEALDTLQRYLVGDSNSENAQMNLTSKGQCTT